MWAWNTAVSLMTDPVGKDKKTQSDASTQPWREKTKSRIKSGFLSSVNTALGRMTEMLQVRKCVHVHVRVHANLIEML